MLGYSEGNRRCIEAKEKESKLVEKRMGTRVAERDEKQNVLQEELLKLPGTMELL